MLLAELDALARPQLMLDLQTTASLEDGLLLLTAAVSRHHALPRQHQSFHHQPAWKLRQRSENQLNLNRSDANAPNSLIAVPNCLFVNVECQTKLPSRPHPPTAVIRLFRVHRGDFWSLSSNLFHSLLSSSDTLIYITT